MSVKSGRKSSLPISNAYAVHANRGIFIFFSLLNIYFYEFFISTAVIRRCFGVIGTPKANAQDLRNLPKS